MKKIVLTSLMLFFLLTSLPNAVAIKNAKMDIDAQMYLQKTVESVLQKNYTTTENLLMNSNIAQCNGFSQYKDFKILVETYFDDTKNYIIAGKIEVRPKTGYGYYFEVVQKDNGRTNWIGEGWCENWNWNGVYTSTQTTYEDSSSVESCVIYETSGMMVDGLLDGIVHGKFTAKDSSGDVYTSEEDHTYKMGKIPDYSSKEDISVLFGHNVYKENSVKEDLIWDESTGTDNVIGELKNGEVEDTEEHVYDVSDVGENIMLPVEKLNSITDIDSAVNVIEQQLNEMSEEQKKSPTGIDLATLYAETAAMRATSKEISGGDILMNAAAVKDLTQTAVEASNAIEAALTNGGITTARKVSKTVVLMTDESNISIKIDPDILSEQIDKIRIETPAYALTFKLEDLKADLTEPLTFTAEEEGAGYAPSKITKVAESKTVVKISLPKGRTSNPVTVSLPKQAGETTYQAVVSTNGTAAASKYNPASDLMDGKVNSSGSYTVKASEKDFTDIANKSQEMQKAIRYLASKGIINGTTATEFSPDKSINRAEIASLIVKALGKLDSTAAANFTDVSRGSWYYSAAASSQKQGYIQGYEDRTFRGMTDISKIQIVSVAGRVLTKEMHYKTPANPSEHLSKYSDGIAKWAQNDVALATKENLVIYRHDETFSGEKNMTRGDAAIIIYRMFQRIW